jgi:Zn-dependent protease/CBS domain-containing protein
LTAGRGGSLQLLQLFGIPIRVHFTFLFLVVWFAVWAAGAGEPAALAMLQLALVFVCVVLHELGHALMARRFGVETQEIVLYPIGGMARLTRIPSGFAELAIAAAGPLVNLVLAGLGIAAMAAAGIAFDLQAGPFGHALLSRLVLANLLLFLFNLLPAFPMDGGRILRASMTFVWSEERATRIAAAIGQGMAVLLALLAFFGPGSNLVLLLIALFVFVGAGQEAAMNRTRSLVRGRTAGEAMMTRFETLKPQDSLEWAARLYLATHQRHFPVVDAWGRIAGLLDRAALLGGISALGREAAVLQAMRREVEGVRPATPLEEVLRRLLASQQETMLVVEDEKLLGMLDLDKVYQFVEVTRRI